MSVFASVGTTGDVTPDPSTTTLNDDLFIRGTMTVGGGSGVLSKTGYIGWQSGDASMATITGSGSAWTNSEDLILGSDGSDATLHVLAGGSVTADRDMQLAMSPGGQSVVSVDGSGSQLIVLGDLLTGNGFAADIDVTNGGSFSVASANILGSLNVDGAGSLMQIDNELAIDGLRVNSGAQVNSGSFLGRMLVDGEGTTVAVTGETRIRGNASTIATGGLLSTGTMWLEQGLFRVTGDGTVVDVAGDFTQTLGSTQVLSGGRLENANVIIDGPQIATTGVTIRGGAWLIDGDLRIAETGRAAVAQLSGQVDILSGDLILSQFPDPTANPGDSGLANTIDPPPGYGIYEMRGGLLDLHGNGILVGGGDSNFVFIGGELRDVGTFAGDLFQAGGILSPGNSTGTTIITGDYGNNTGTLAIELAGTTPGSQHDKVVVSGELFLGETSVLDVVFIDGFTPLGGETFDILDFGSIDGTFNTINLPALAAGLLWDDSQLYTDGSLSVILQLLLGDADGDGDVDAFDITAVEQNFGNTGVADGSLLGDADHDGDVDAFDITAVEQNFGNVLATTSSPELTTVPEPTSLALLGIGGLMVVRRQRR